MITAANCLRTTVCGKTCIRFQSGQALAELIMIMPILVLLVAWMLNGFKGIRAATVAERSAFANLMSRLDNRSTPAYEGLDREGTNSLDTLVNPLNRSYKAVVNQPAPNQSAQVDRYAIRIDDTSSLGTTTSSGTGGNYGIAVGVCFYLHDKCDRP